MITRMSRVSHRRSLAITSAISIWNTLKALETAGVRWAREIHFAKFCVPYRLFLLHMAHSLYANKENEAMSDTEELIAAVYEYARDIEVNGVPKKPDTVIASEFRGLADALTAAESALVAAKAELAARDGVIVAALASIRADWEARGCEAETILASTAAVKREGGGWVFALSLSEKVHPNDRMFFDTADQVAEAVGWALANPLPGAELLLTVAEPAS